jgi:hypothetical protein
VITDILYHKNMLESALLKKDYSQSNFFATYLFKLAIQEYSDLLCDQVLSDARIIKEIFHLRHMLAINESIQEKIWAKRIIADGISIHDFPDYHQYDALLKAEISKIENTPSIKNICFLGCGAMPLTAIALSKFAEVRTISAYDNDSEALELANSLFKNHATPKISCHLQDAQNIDYLSFDLIFVASLVTNKTTVLKRISDTSKINTIIVIRTAEKMRRLIYEPIDINNIPKNFKVLAYTGIVPQSSNSTYFFELNS